MVAAVYLRVAVHTVAAEQKRARIACWKPAAIGELAGMECRRMTLLAQERSMSGQQRLDHRSVRVVTKGAVFGHGLMLKQKRAPFFRMTGITGVVQRWLNKGRTGARSMRVVTIDAGCPPFENWVAGAQPNLTLYPCVTIEADAGLRDPVQRVIGLSMDCVAVGAANVFAVVHATHPQHLG